MYKKEIKNFFLNKYLEKYFNKYLNLISSNILLISFFFIWIFEWLYIFEYSLSFNTFVYLFFPYRLPILLIIVFIYFIYVWGISVWRRTQYGRFTRGDRKLWYKGYASFWFVELSTVLGLVIAAAWMNWGPTPLFPRSFYVTRKSFLIEVTFFSYILWILYLMRFSLKWNKWKTQLLLTSFILVLTSYLIWRDILIIYGRENINLYNGQRWKHLTTGSLLYSVYPEWWMNHFINQKKNVDLNSLFYKLSDCLQNIEILTNNQLFQKEINLGDYEKYNFNPIVFVNDFNKNSLPLNYFFSSKNSFFYYNIINFFSINELTLDSYKYFPRKIGYQPKRLAMWTFFFFLKIWHHLMLFIWWFIYLIRLYGKKKNSYSWLSICHFNIYCCFIISFLIFIFSYFPWFEMFFRFFKKKHTMLSIIKYVARIQWGFDYLYSLYLGLIRHKSYKNSNHSLLRVNTKILYKILYYNNMHFKIKGNFFNYILNKSNFINY